MARPPGTRPRSVQDGTTRGTIPGLPARILAAEGFRRALVERRSIEEALSLSLKHNTYLEGISGADQGLARAIVTVAFRRLGTIRLALAARLHDGAMPQAGRLEDAMIIGAAQILFLNVPDHAAVDLAVEIAKADRHAKHYASLVNAVLRRISRDKDAILDTSDAFTMDTPLWLAERWSQFYGEDNARAIALIHRSEPHIDLTPMGDVAALHATLGGVILPTGSLRLETEAGIASLPGYDEGEFFVQDAASALPAKLLKAAPGMRILDLCAAPGGKTAQLAAAGAAVVAVERSAQRMVRFQDNMTRLHLHVEIVIADAGVYERDGFDAVLLDAPCSATGTIRRHPEIAWTKKLEDVLALARQQERLLAHAVERVRPGGIIVYATCSLEREEGEKQIECLLEARKDVVRVPITPDELGVRHEMVNAHGELRILPSHFAAMGGVDGFFAARLQRRG